MALTPDQQARFDADLAWLANHDGWTQEDDLDVRRNIDEFGKEAIRFWWCLAKARMAGYRFDATSGYEKLHQFCERVGMPGPYAPTRNSGVV